MKIILIIVIIILVIFLNILWYKIKFILKDNKYHVDYFVQHFTDIPNFISLIRKERDKNIRNGYIKILAIMIITLAVAITCFVYLLNRFG